MINNVAELLACPYVNANDRIVMDMRTDAINIHAEVHDDFAQDEKYSLRTRYVLIFSLSGLTWGVVVGLIWGLSKVAGLIAAHHG